MNIDSMISLEDVTKVYKVYKNSIDRLKEVINPFRKVYHEEFKALKNVSFEIKKGETVGIIGKNGSGKSTILKIIAGITTPTSGKIIVNGRVSALLELGAGFNPELTGVENIYLNGSIMGINKSEMEKRLPKILEFADIGEFVYRPIKTYSSGMFARLAFSVSINVNPDILIVDEALAVGDLRFQLKCMQEFTKLRENGTTILFVSHDINAIKRFCTSTIWVNEGEIWDIGDTDIVTDRYLDYLKLKESSKDDVYREDQFILSNYDIMNNSNALDKKVEIAEILNVELYNKNKNISDKFKLNDTMYVRVDYYVADLSIEQPVLGVAIRSLDDEYICGLNTLLDDVKISWNKGLNTIYLNYKNLNLIGGSYYLDVALFDKTATVKIDYKSKIKVFIINSMYRGEGKIILDHEWWIKERGIN